LDETAHEGTRSDRHARAAHVSNDTRALFNENRLGAGEVPSNAPAHDDAAAFYPGAHHSVSTDRDRARDGDLAIDEPEDLHIRTADHTAMDAR
jgi:hypothetical protein